MPAPQITGIMGMISAAVTPVVLISAVAILFSGLTAKHSHLADQIRNLTQEYRHSETPADRRRIIRKQLRLFERRINALWLANSFLTLAIISFISTILSVIYFQQTPHVGPFVIGSLLTGLSCLMVGLLLEMFETVLARWSIIGETADIDFAKSDDIMPPLNPNNPL